MKLILEGKMIMEKLTIKSIYPIPKDFYALTLVEDTYCDLTLEGWMHMLALVDGGPDNDDYVTVYSIDSLGIGDTDACRLVREVNCPICQKRLSPNLCGKSLSVYEPCTCGNKLQTP
jgi:hypothetical protein